MIGKITDLFLRRFAHTPTSIASIVSLPCSIIWTKHHIQICRHLPLDFYQHKLATSLCLFFSAYSSKTEISIDSDNIWTEDNRRPTAPQPLRLPLALYVVFNYNCATPFLLHALKNNNYILAKNRTSIVQILKINEFKYIIIQIYCLQAIYMVNKTWKERINQTRIHQFEKVNRL